MNENSHKASGSSLSIWTAAAAFVGLIGLAGTLFLSLGMQLRACPLCFYQRIFVMAVVGVLVLGLFVHGGRPGLVSLLALPAAAGGLAIAGWHNYLEASGIMECPLGVGGLGSAPQQSMAVFALLTLLLFLDLLLNRLWLPGLMALVLGGGFAFGAIQTTPNNPLPRYEIDVNEDMCRKIKKPDPS